MGPVYDQPRETLTHGAGRREPALPDHGGRRPDPLDPRLRLRARARLAPEHARLDDQQEALLGAGAADLRLRGVRARSRSSAAARSCSERAVEGWDDVRGPHAAPAVRRRGPDRLPGVRRAGRADPGRRQPVAGRRDRAVLDAPLPRGPGLLGEVVPGRLHHRELPRPVPQLVLLDARDVHGPPPRAAVPDDLRLRHCVFGEDGRPMHKSWGNAIEFDEAAERMGVDVMRWMFARARPEENILFGWHAADEARRELLVLWNVYAFFVTYARLAGWTPAEVDAATARPSRPALDRWILSRAAGLAAARRRTRLARLRRRSAATRAICDVHRRPLDLVPAPVAPSGSRGTDDRGRPRRRVRDAPRGARRAGPGARADPAVPRPSRCTATSWRRSTPDAAGQRPPDPLADAPSWPAIRDEALEAAMATARRAVELARTLRGAAGLKARQPLAPALARAAGRRAAVERDALLELSRDEVNVKARRADRRRVGARRAAGEAAPAEDRQAARRAIPAVMAAARAGEVEFHADGSRDAGRRDAGARRGRDPGHAAARARPSPHDEGLVVVIDTELTPELRAEGDARELAAGDPGPPPRGRARARRPDRAVGRGRSRRRVAAHLADRRRRDAGRRWPRGDAAGRRRARRAVELEAGRTTIALRRRAAGRVNPMATGDAGQAADVTSGTVASRAHWFVFPGSPRDRGPRPADEGVARRERPAGRRRSRSSATTSGSSSAATTARCSACSASNAADVRPSSRSS